MRDETLTEARNSKMKMEIDLIKAQRQAEDNANAAAILTDFMNKGLARINEKGQYELLNQQSMESFEQVKVKKKSKRSEESEQL